MIFEELRRWGFEVGFLKYYWMGDVLFGFIIVEINKGDVVIRWLLGKEFCLRFEEIEKEDYDEFVEDILEYFSGD